MKKLVVFLTLVMLFSQSGCGVVALVGTPTRHEKKIPAEYDLTELGNQKVLVLVNQPGWLDAQANLRYYLTEEMNKSLIEKIKIPSTHLVSYSELSEFRSNRPNFSLLSPVEIGAALDADMVLLVMLEDYQLNEIAETGYYKGLLNTRNVLIDVAAGRKLWPETAKSKSIKVGFEVEELGREVALKRLAEACAYCTTRYFYDCPKHKFKIADDRSSIGWERWKK